MTLKSLFIALLLCCPVLFFSFNGPADTAKTDPGTPAPKVMQEFRAAWVATVVNIDWPGKPGLPAEIQKQEAINLLNFLQSHHFNAVILQVRPQADALYKSELEPWSYYLTGQQGKAPEPFYDPLEFWIHEAHERGLELHVWLNPFRAHHKEAGLKDSATQEQVMSSQSIVKKHPDWVVQLKEGYWWMDPARQEVQDRTLAVVTDILKRYDIDGLHMDDYFYPYPSYNGYADFPDSFSWSAYRRNGGKLSRADWRRNAVNKLVERIYRNIKAIKPWVKFGISPFGIWRPGYPASIRGFDQYNQLYADARLWLNRGWVDYFCPQLYWPIHKQGQSFRDLLAWWAGENKMKRNLWPGINLEPDSTARNIRETIDEILLDRRLVPKNSGVAHWSISSLTNYPALADTLIKSVYKKQALVPPSPWLDNTAPLPPVAETRRRDGAVEIRWQHPDAADVFRWVVYYQYGNDWDYRILSRNERSLEIKKSGGVANAVAPLKKIIVTAVDRTGNESEKRELILK